MNFKKIELYGFKSFVDKTEIKFDQGITAIVGPNGCGKSNFADAVRWIMGEQRTKLLRVDNITGVIFNGTDLRKPISFCEASLFFDNSNRIFPVDFEEVVITRKAFRSGSSEFYINNTPCRLKDIQDLLRDTGMGREGYSIIAQGQITNIVASKPKERRAIFEEAAGIATFKTRKETAERKLDNTLTNMSTIQAVKEEIEKQLTPLKKQAENARVARDLLEQLKETEINLYIYQTENTEAIKSKTKQRIQEAKEEMEKINFELESLANLSVKQSNRLKEVEEILRTLQAEYTECLLKQTETKGKSGILSEKLNAALSNKDRLVNEMKEDEEIFENTKKNLFLLTEKLNTKTQQLEGEKEDIDRIAREFQALVKEVSDMEANLEASRDSIMSALGLLSEIKTNKGKFEKEKELLEEKATELSEAKEKTRADIEEAEGEKSKVEKELQESNRAKINLQKVRDQADGRLKEAEFQAQLLRKQLEDLAKEISAYETKQNIMERFREDYEGFQRSVKNLMQRAQESQWLSNLIEGVVAELIKVKEEHEVAITAALGGAMQNVVTRNADDTREIIKYLKENNLGQITFLPISTYKSRDLESDFRGALKCKGVLGIAKDLVKYESRYENIFSGLLGRTVVCDNIDNAVDVAEKYNYSFRIVTLDGDLINPSGAIRGGSKRVDSSNILTQDRVIEETKKILEQKKKENEEKQELFVENIENIEILKEELEKSKELLENKNIEIAKKEESISKIQDIIDNLLETLNLQDSSYAANQRRLDLITSGLKEVEKEGADAEGKRTSRDEEAEKAKLAFAKKQEEKEKKNQEWTDKKLIMLALEKEIATIREEIGREKIEQQDAQERTLNNSYLLSEAKKSIEQIQLDIAKAVVTPEERKHLDYIKQQNEERDKEKTALQEEISSITEKRETLLRNLSEANERCVRQEDHLIKIESEMTALAEHIIDEYNLTYREAVKFKVEDFDHKGASSKITSLKRSISRLGAVNYQAIEQYEIILERHTRYEEQLNDLSKAEKDLRSIITDLSKAMVERFNAEFEKINKNFGETFKELFGGGRANLSILPVEPGEDMLSAGIDILAEPPGKKLQTIAALSGGEQTLTAIAILFAILKIKAVPFCVLDEIEAALDDSNARLFARYLARLAKETQFIVITHKKPTMEYADKLFGVTMQEPGVSKIVKVTLSEAVKHAQDQE